MPARLAQPRPHLSGLRARILACGIAAVAGGMSSRRSAADQAAVPVVVARVSMAEQGTGQSFVGTVMPARVSDVGSAVDGRIVDFPIVDDVKLWTVTLYSMSSSPFYHLDPQRKFT